MSDPQARPGPPRRTVTVLTAEDVDGRFLSVRHDSIQSVSYIARTRPGVELGSAAIQLYDREDANAQRLGYVRVGDTVTLADDEQVQAYILLAADHFAPPAPVRRPAASALFPAAVVFSTAFLFISVATGNTGLTFLTGFSPVSQLLMPVLAGMTAGLGLQVMSALTYRSQRAAWIMGLTKSAAVWEDRRRQQESLTASQSAPRMSST